MAHGRHRKALEKVPSIGFVMDSHMALGNIFLCQQHLNKHCFTSKLKLRHISLYNSGEKYYYAFVGSEYVTGKGPDEVCSCLHFSVPIHQTFPVNVSSS